MRKIAGLVVALVMAVQLLFVAAPAVAGPEDKLGIGCLVWVWIDGWRCAVP